MELLWIFIGTIIFMQFIFWMVSWDLRCHPQKRKWPYNSVLYHTVRDIQREMPKLNLGDIYRDFKKLERKYPRLVKSRKE